MDVGDQVEVEVRLARERLEDLGGAEDVERLEAGEEEDAELRRGCERAGAVSVCIRVCVEGDSCLLVWFASAIASAGRSSADVMRSMKRRAMLAELECWMTELEESNWGWNYRYGHEQRL